MKIVFPPNIYLSGTKPLGFKLLVKPLITQPKKKKKKKKGSLTSDESIRDDLKQKEFLVSWHYWAQSSQQACYYQVLRYKTINLSGIF